MFEGRGYESPSVCVMNVASEGFFCSSVVVDDWKDEDDDADLEC